MIKLQAVIQVVVCGYLGYSIVNYLLCSSSEPFDEDTPLKLINRIKPDVLAKGCDYKPEEVVGYKEVTQHGGEVVIIGWKNEHSTTTLASRLSKPKPAEINS